MAVESPLHGFVAVRNVISTVALTACVLWRDVVGCRFPASPARIACRQIPVGCSIILLALETGAFRMDYGTQNPELQEESGDETGDLGAIGGGWRCNPGCRLVGPSRRSDGPACRALFAIRSAAYCTTCSTTHQRRRTDRGAVAGGRQRANVDDSRSSSANYGCI